MVGTIYKITINKKQIELLIIVEYDGYDDVYGHSVEEDYCMSPSEAAFMYDREGSRNQRGIGVFLQTENNIAEEDEEEIKEVSVIN